MTLGLGPPQDAAEPSRLVRALAVVSIVGGSIVGFAELVDLAKQIGALGAHPVALPPTTPDPPLSAALNAAERLGAEVAPFVLARDALMLVMSVVLIVIGAGLLRQREVARKAARAWSLSALVVLGARALVFECVLWPKVRLVMQAVGGAVATVGAPDLTHAFTGLARFAEYASLVVLAVLPILLISLMGMPTVKQGMRK